MTAVRRVTSILLSTVMLLGNMVSPMMASVEEAVPEGNEGYEVSAKEAAQEQIQTEAPDYLVTIPYYGEVTFMMNLEKVNVVAADGSKAIAMFKLPGGAVVAHGSQQPDRKKVGPEMATGKKKTVAAKGETVKLSEKGKLR